MSESLSIYVHFDFLLAAVVTSWVSVVQTLTSVLRMQTFVHTLPTASTTSVDTSVSVSRASRRSTCQRLVASLSRTVEVWFYI